MEVEEGMSTGKYTSGFGPFENDPDLESKIAQAISLADTSNVQAAIDSLLTLERTNRGAAAAPETSAVCVNIIRLLRKQDNWNGISEYTILISKRRAQLKAAVQKTVQEVISYLSETPDEKTKLSFLEMLRDVTAGKIFVELERARVTRILATIKEDNGDLDGAATIMQEMQVETFGGMQRKEKFDFILEQIRLSLEKNDFIRGAIISKKIMPRQLNKPELVDIKMQYYALMIRIHNHNEDYLEMCRSYLERYDSCRENDKNDSWIRELKLSSLMVVLTSQDSMQSDLLHRVKGFKTLADLPTYQELLRLFSTSELIRWPVLLEQYSEELATIASEVKLETKGDAVNWKPALHDRVTEHNLRVMSKYYSRIRLERLAELLDLSEENTERKLASMVSDKKALWAKIDRPAKIVSFAKPKDADAVLNSWATNVATLLDSVEKTCHLVHRETMIHNIEKLPIES